MKIFSRLTKKSNQITVFIFIFVLLIFSFAAATEHNRALESEKQKIKDQLFMIKSNFESTITSKMIGINGMGIHIKMDNSMSQSDFNSFAREVYDSSDQLIKTIAYLTDTTITHTFPYEENSNTIGVDLSQVEGQGEFVRFAKEENRPVFIAPVDLIQGGRGMISRLPVYNQSGYYGQIAIVFDFDKTFTQTGIYELGNNNYVDVMMADPLNHSKKIIWSNRNNEDTIDFEDSWLLAETIRLYDSTLEIQTIPKNGWSGMTPVFYFIMLSGIMMASFASFTTFKILDTTSELQEKYDEIQENQSHINYLANHDPLTDLYNRRKFIEDIDERLLWNKKGSLVLMDLDNFKNINDTLGYLYGDKVIAHVANLIKKTLIDKGSVYRIDGDEFLILIEDKTEAESILQIVQELNELIEKNNSIDGIDNHITTSAGMIRYPVDGNIAEDLLMKLDIAMYDAKSSGKNQYKFFHDDMMIDFDEKIRVEKILRRAYEENMFTLVYQPVIETRTGKINYFEALLRIKDNSLSPAEFIPVAEETGLISRIGKRVIEEVLLQQKIFAEKGFKVKPIAVNLSPRQLLDEDLSDFINQKLQEYDVAPELISFEITESVLLDHKDERLHMLNKIKELGISIALDDFGTGYSSLNYLSFIPVDTIKLDKSLKDRFISSDKKEVVEGIITIAHGLQFSVVAEGVETEEDLQWLKEKKCDFLQGYFFSRPETPEVIEKIYDKVFSH